MANREIAFYLSAAKERLFMYYIEWHSQGLNLF